MEPFLVQPIDRKCNTGPVFFEPINQEDLEVMHVMIFLPHKFHLLLKMLLYQNETLIVIYTDYWRILPFIDSYIENVVTE